LAPQYVPAPSINRVPLTITQAFRVGRMPTARRALQLVAPNQDRQCPPADSPRNTR